MSTKRLGLAIGLVFAVSTASIAEKVRNAEPSVESTGQVAKDPSKLGLIDTFADCTVVGTNDVVNCGFETGDFTGWTQFGSTSSTGVDGFSAQSGSYGAYLGPTDIGCITQLVNTPTFFLYNLSFWLRNNGQPSEFDVYWNNVLISSWFILPNFVYTQFSFNELDTPNSVTALDFCFRNTPDYIRLDDIVAVGH